MANTNEDKTETAGETPIEQSSDENSTNEINIEQKSEAQAEVENDSPEILNKIKSQIEFYFGDVNMQRDKFLIDQVKLDDGWIPMSIMLQFKMLASISTNIDTILKAIDTSDLMEISEDKKKIRRRLDKPLPLYNEEYRKAQLARTVYVKPFPQKLGIQEIKDFFKDIAPIENIILRKYKDENKKLQFKGSIFVQFENIEDAKKFIEMKSVVYNNTELLRKFSEDYTLDKSKERHEKKRSDDKETEPENKAEKNDGKDDLSKFPKGAVLHITTVSKNMLWEDIKQAFTDLEAKILFVDYKNGSPTGWIRFQGENSARSILEKITDNKIKIKDSDVIFRLLDGNEEEEYLAKVKKDQNISKTFKGKKFRGKKGSKRGRKRAGSPVTDVAKKKLTA